MGNIPDEPWVWALLILAGAVVVVVALVKGGAVEVSLNPPKLGFRRREKGAQQRVKILEEAEIEGEVGNVTGVKRNGGNSSQGAVTSEVEVGKGMKVGPGGDVGDISGVVVDSSDKTKGPRESDN